MNEGEARRSGFRGLSGSVLKWIAIITMFIDHIGASLIEVYIVNYYGNSPYQGFSELLYEQRLFIIQLDQWLRIIGRISFPIFCFLLVEGFVHTSNVKKYALRLAAFCVISEIPFDLAFQGVLFNWRYQNIFFTLLFGLLGIWAMEYFQDKKLLAVLGAIGAMLLADFCKTDYGAFGVFLIEVLYVLRERKLLRAVAGIACLVMHSAIEAVGSVAFLPISMYNGERGNQPKYFFYIFYPAHLLLIVLIGRFLLPYIL